jgi:hypothetical protein
VELSVLSYDKNRIAVLQKLGDFRKGKEFEDGPMEVALDVALREARQFPTHMDGEPEVRDHIIRRMGQLMKEQPEQLLREALGNREYSQKVDSIATRGTHGEYVLKNPPPKKEPPAQPEAIAQPGQSTRFNDLKYWKNGDPNSAKARYERWGANQMYRRRGE